MVTQLQCYHGYQMNVALTWTKYRLLIYRSTLPCDTILILILCNRGQKPDGGPQSPRQHEIAVSLRRHDVRHRGHMTTTITQTFTTTTRFLRLFRAGMIASVCSETNFQHFSASLSWNSTGSIGSSFSAGKEGYELVPAIYTFWVTREYHDFLRGFGVLSDS